jgi:hypothetical protein
MLTNLKIAAIVLDKSKGCGKCTRIETQSCMTKNTAVSLQQRFQGKALTV